MTTWRLSGFGDEIGPDPALQAAVLRSLGAAHIEVRGAWDTNVLDLDDNQLTKLRKIFDDAGVQASSIASPIGKSQASQPVEFELGRLQKAIACAHALGTTNIRIFSFYPEQGQPLEEIRDAVMTRLEALATAAEKAGVTLLHENEKDIYGDIPQRVVDIANTVDSPALRLVWDAANYVQCGVQHPYDDGFAQLAHKIAYLHVKDALLANGEVTPAGEGDGQVAMTIAALKDRGYEGFASLEPHLLVAGHSIGFSGPYEFGRAARALRRLTDAEGIELQ